LVIKRRFLFTGGLVAFTFAANMLPAMAADTQDTILPSTTLFDQSWQLSSDEIKRLQSGKITVYDTSENEGYIKELRAFLIVESNPENLLATISDYEKLPEFMPNLEHVDVLEQDENGALVNYVLALPFGVQKRYRLRLNYDKTTPNFSMSWHSEPWQGLKPEETIKYTTGSWIFKPIDKNTTLVVYYTKTDPGHVPFGLGWIVNYLTEKTVLELLKNTRKRAEIFWNLKDKDTSN